MDIATDHLRTARHLTPSHEPACCAGVAEYRREWNRLHQDKTAARVAVERELAELNRKINRIIDAIENAMFHPAMKDRMTVLGAEKPALSANRAS